MGEANTRAALPTGLSHRPQSHGHSWASERPLVPLGLTWAPLPASIMFFSLADGPPPTPRPLGCPAAPEPTHIKTYHIKQRLETFLILSLDFDIGHPRSGLHPDPVRHGRGGHPLEPTPHGGPWGYQGQETGSRAPVRAWGVGRASPEQVLK